MTLKQVMKNLEKQSIVVLKKSKVSLDNKSTWLLETTRGNLILKIPSSTQNKGIIRKIISFIHPDSSLYFQNELEIYNKFNIQSFEFFRFPKLLFGNSDFILMRYVEGEKGWNKNSISKESFANALMEFNNIGNKLGKKKALIKTNLRMQITLHAISKILKKTSLKISISIIRVVFLSLFNKKPRGKRKLIHNDLFGENNLLTVNDEIYFLDFETATIEKEWVLKDIIEISFNRDLSFDKELFFLYVECLDDDYTQYYENQFRMILLLRVIKLILSSFEENIPLREKHISFLYDIILPRNSFYNWLNENVY